MSSPCGTIVVTEGCPVEGVPTRACVTIADQRLGVRLTVSRIGATLTDRTVPPQLPTFFLVTESGDYIVDETGRYIIAG